MELEKVCREGHATVGWVKLGISLTSFGTQHIHTNDEETSHFMETRVDAFQAHVFVDVEEKEEFIGTTKQALPSSLQGDPPRKKNEISSIDQMLWRYVVMMTYSISLVTNAT